jgi:hypothetical protein
MRLVGLKVQNEIIKLSELIKGKGKAFPLQVYGAQRVLRG